MEKQIEIGDYVKTPDESMYEVIDIHHVYDIDTFEPVTVIMVKWHNGQMRRIDNNNIVSVYRKIM